MPNSPQQGGSGLTGALGNAVHAACVNLLQAFIDLLTNDEQSPLRGCTIGQLTARDGGIGLTSNPARFETYADILTRHKLDELTTDGDSAPPGDTVPHGETSFAA